MEGHTPEEYDRFRVGARWQKVIDNLRGLVDARRVAGRRCPLIVVRGIALEGLEGQRRAHAAYYREMGADQVMWVPAANWSGSLRAPQGSVRTPPLPARTQRCTFPRLQLGIDWNGMAVPCCVDFSGKNALGNVDTTPLRELWNGAEIAALRRSLATRDRHQIEATTGCAGCSYLSQPALPLRKKAQLVRMLIGEFRSRFLDS
jgi:radical SAM protein with 4Fe4S-binding SPASM domain